MTNWKADKGKTYGWCGWINKSVGLSVFVKKYCLKNWQIASQTQIQTTIWWAKRQNGRTEWGRGYKCPGRLNCGIDSHWTSHVGSSLSLLLLHIVHFMHSHPTSVPHILCHQKFNLLLSCSVIKLSQEWATLPPNALSYREMSGRCHLVSGTLSLWNCQYLSLVGNVSKLARCTRYKY